jgi:hypothetical protein
MLKLVIRFLLTSCFLLLGWYAHTSQAPIGLPQSSVDTPAQDSYTVFQYDRSFFIAAPAPGTDPVSDPFEGREDEEDDDDDDDEVKSSKKHSGSGSGGMPSFYQQASAWVYSISCRLPFCEHLSYTSAFKFIMHCVIRI